MEDAPSMPYQLRLRVFAGPNGSGKSTVIKSVRETLVNGRKLDLGTYINADDIAVALRKNRFFPQKYKVEILQDEILQFASGSGLINADFTYHQLQKSFVVSGNRAKLLNKHHTDRVSQILARFLREKLLQARKRFSFETVFSHESNLDIMRRAAEQGYKVYLYFVSTEDPEINKYRVALRVKRNGHDVPPDRIESRYYRSLGLVRYANQIAYQSFFFDNTVNDQPIKLVGHFKRTGNMQLWDEIDEEDVSQWFYKYCV